jgi:site-specific recombinase XerD
MRGDRGLSEETIRDYRAAADQFFDWLAAADIPLASVRITDIDHAITDKKARGTCNRRTMHDYAQRLRAFFRFAETRGWCVPGLAKGIMPPRFQRDEAVPRGLKREDVLRLLATTGGGRPVDKRDRAILMVFIAYGLRAGEVGGLRLDDLDWENEMLRVRCSKPGRTQTYPLSRGVGEAILRYIREVRPSGFGRTLFFTMRAPIQPLSRRALGKIVRDRLGILGISTGKRGTHALRHAAAQHLLDHGMSMKVIGDFLGHRDPSSTAIYAKVNLPALREVAALNLEGLV